MKHIRTALTLTLALCPWLQAPAASAPSPLGMEPARIAYLANDAPFVVFDITPRSLGGEPTPSGQGHAVLTFIATDPLRQVSVAVAARPDRPGAREVAAVRTTCGPQIAGYHRCPIPTDVALTHLDGDGGSIGLRIEAEGPDGERSIVQITLPVRALRAAAPSEALSAVARRQ
jgi:hypothetical protein